jgi:hypothetical protein
MQCLYLKVPTFVKERHVGNPECPALSRLRHKETRCNDIKIASNISFKTMATSERGADHKVRTEE